MTLLTAGTRISPTLVVDRFIGQGAYAEVHRVDHEYLGWQAVKLFKQVASLDQTREMLEEARLLSTLGHANIVRLFDAGTVTTPEGVRGWFTMEYVVGGNLERLVSSHRGIVPVDVVVTVLEQTAAGLAVAHAQSPPVVHRDLTLANILVGYDGAGLRVRISDFGLAKKADPFTLLASAQGTCAFLAPEVLRDEGYSCAADVWSLGTVAYRLLTNRFPYDDGDPLSSWSAARFRRPLLPPSRFNVDVGDDLDGLVLSMLDVDRGRRPSDAVALVERLHDLRGHAGRTRRPPSEPEPPRTEQDVAAAGMAVRAHALATDPAQLDRAADLLEEAISLSPRLLAHHLPHLLVWRRGVMM